MNRKAIFAIFKRDLASYFGNPSGYVFICAFLLACGFAAFWPEEFFNANLANLDLLNQYLPHILLGFIPAITMSVWAEERRQGTDELLLTLPGSDLDVVIGKYFGSVAIFTVAMFLSFVSNTVVLYNLGDPDLGLIFANYFGAWMMGLAMLAVGMVASFLTTNLTVAFVLGVALNAPLALLTSWDWGFAVNLIDFKRGVISLSGMVFFLGVTASMLYFCSILIGRRHWEGGPKGPEKTIHFSIRVIAIIIVAGSLTAFFRNHDIVRVDATVAKLSQLSEGSLKLLDTIDGTVEIEAYVSPREDFPEEYVQVRANLMSMLRELNNEGGDAIRVKVHEIESTSPAAETAENEGIENKNGSLYVQEKDRGMTWNKDLYMGLVFRGSAGKKTLDFLYKGLPVEYELISNIMIVGSKAQKKKLGVFTTDAPVMGSAPMGMFGFNMNEGIPPWDFITELQKHYEVREVTASEVKERTKIEAIIGELEKASAWEDALQNRMNKGGWDENLPASLTDALNEANRTKTDSERKKALSEAKTLNADHFDYAALLVIQPSTLDPEGLAVLIDEIENGIPTAIFEDPLAIIAPITGTYEDRRSEQQRPPMGRQAPPAPPKGDISKLWSLLGVHFNANPKERLEALTKELEELEGKAKIAWQPIMGFKPVRQVLENLDKIQAGVGKLQAKLNSGAAITASEWESNCSLDSLLEPVRNLTQKDQLYQIKLIVEQSFIRETENRVAGLEKRVLWDTYNPFPKILKGKDQNFPDEFVYLGGKKESLSDDLVTSELQYLLFTAPGCLYSANNPDRVFTPFLSTRGSIDAGTTSLADFWQTNMMGQRTGFNPGRTKYSGERKQYVVSAAIDGKKGPKALKVVLVADVDVLANPFYRLRREPDPMFPLDVDNVPFSLNVIDHLTGESNMLEVRNRIRKHRTLAGLEDVQAKAEEESLIEIKNAENAFDEAVMKIEGNRTASIAKIIQEEGASMSPEQRILYEQTENEKWRAQIDKIKDKENRKLNKAIQASNRKRDAAIEKIRSKIRVLAVGIPPVPLLLIAIFVFIKKRVREMEGASVSRVRK